MPIEQIIQAKLAALPTPVPPVEHAKNASYMSPEAGNFIEYRDWRAAGENEDDACCDQAIAFCFMPDKFYRVMSEAADFPDTKEFLLRLDPRFLRELATRFEVYLNHVEDDGDADPTAPVLRPRPWRRNGLEYGY